MREETECPDDDDDWDDEEDDPEALMGEPPGEVEVAEEPDIMDILLRLSGDATKALILLNELDDQEFAMVAPRLNTLFSLIQQFPRRAQYHTPEERPIGFNAPPPRKSKKKKTKR